MIYIAVLLVLWSGLGLKAFKVENFIIRVLLQSLLRHLSDDLGMTLSLMKRAALSPNLRRQVVPKKQMLSKDVELFDSDRMDAHQKKIAKF